MDESISGLTPFLSFAGQPHYVSKASLDRGVSSPRRCLPLAEGESTDRNQRYGGDKHQCVEVTRDHCQVVDFLRHDESGRQFLET